MSQITKTSIFVGSAALLAVLAALVVPGNPRPGVFQDQGQNFFAPFGVELVASIEVVDYSADQAEPRHFKVEYQGGHWLIPSHEGYPADMKDHLARMSVLLADLKKGDLRSDREADYEQYGVADPESPGAASAAGRGRRVTIRSSAGAVLADLIIGKDVEGRQSYRYVREPGAKRIYTCKIDAAAISTRFADWVETDVLKLAGADVRQIVFDNYKVQIDNDEASLVTGETLTVNHEKEGAWQLGGGVPTGFVFDSAKLDAASDMLQHLTLVGVRRKPPQMVRLMERVQKGESVTQREWIGLSLLLQTAGYFLGPDPSTGALRVLSKEGETRVACDDGVVYTLRFGDIVVGDPDELSAASTKPAAATTASTLPTQPAAPNSREHRYLFVTVGFDPSLLGDKPVAPTSLPSTTRSTTAATGPATGPATASTQPDATAAYNAAKAEYDRKLADYEKKLADGKKRRDDLARRFDDWYYVVSAEAFAKVKLTRADLVTKPTTQPQTAPAMEMPH